MKVLSILGYSNTGKTTSIEAITKELKRRNYTVGTIKSIHHNFVIDENQEITGNYRKSGSDLITTRAEKETVIMYQGKKNIYELLQLYKQDYVIIEGETGINAPEIITADNIEGIEKKISNRTFLISGKISDNIEEYNRLKAISVLKDIGKIVDIIEEKTFQLLPDYSETFCNLCGYNCRKMCELILLGEKSRKDCVLSNENFKIKLDGIEIKLNSSMKNALCNAYLGLEEDIEEYNNDFDMEIELGIDYNNNIIT